MGKTSKWIRNLLTGKKDRDKVKEKEGTTVPTENPTTPLSTTPNTPKEKRRWSFRRSTTTGTAPRDSNSVDSIPATPPPVVQNMSESENEQKKHTVVTTAAADAPVAKMQAATAETVVKTAAAASADIQLTTSAIDEQIAFEEAAATKIQSVFRSYLARKALCALKGLVKLQALVRGHLVRKQATTTLRCMQALVTVQARARAQRIKLVEDGEPSTQRHSVHRSPQRIRSKQSYDEMDRGMDDNIKIVEMDLGEARGSATSRHSYSNHQQVEKSDHRFSAYYPPRPPSRQENQPQFSPAPSAMTDMSPRTCSGHFEEYSFTTAQSSPHYYSSVSKPDQLKAPFVFPRPAYAESMSHDYTLFPNYMANTQSSKAKARSQSAPKQRPDSYERPPSRRRASIEGRNVPRAVRMQRSSSHVGSTAQGYQYSGSIKLDRSAVSLKDSECGSTSTILTNTNYCRSLVSYEPHAKRY